MNESGMAALKARLDVITTYIPPDKPLIYLDYPLHLNIGDLLIWLGAEDFLARHRYRIEGRDPGPGLRRDLRRRITPDTTIVMHGGGNFGDLYPVHQRFRERVAEAFPDNKLILLPQTVHFDDIENAITTARIFNRHRDITFFVRDEPSRDFVAKHFGAPIEIVPDMAHQLWGTIGDPSADGSGTLKLIRQDIEATEPLVTFGHQVDWIDLIPWRQRKLHRLVRALHTLEGGVGHTLGGADVWQSFCRTLCSRMAAYFGEHRVIVTNRLHACILGALLEREVRFFDNSYGKLGAYTDAWMADLANVGRLTQPRLSEDEPCTGTDPC